MLLLSFSPLFGNSFLNGNSLKNRVKLVGSNTVAGH